MTPAECLAPLTTPSVPTGCTHAVLQVTVTHGRHLGPCAAPATHYYDVVMAHSTIRTRYCAAHAGWEPRAAPLNTNLADAVSLAR